MQSPVRCFYSRTNNGWTLIELLLSVGIALLIVALLTSVYHTVLSASQGQAARRGQEEARQALSYLSRDLQTAFHPEGDITCQLSLTNRDHPNKGFRLSFCTAIPNEREIDLRWFNLIGVHYETATDEIGTRLLRVTTPLVGPGSLMPPVTNELVHQVRKASVSLFDGEDWIDVWPASEPPKMPKAARLVLSVGNGIRPMEWTTEIFLPSGTMVRPGPFRESDSSR